MDPITIRPATPDDCAVILALVPRLVAFGPPPWRDPAAMIATDQRVLDALLRNPPAGTVFFVAQDDTGQVLGFIHLQPGHDYYQAAPHGHISDVIIAPHAEGRGVARALIAQGEAWAQAQGYGWLTLNVFSQNQRARDLYAKLGYGADIVKYVKPLSLLSKD